MTVQIYTDGSHCRMGSGWATVVVIDGKKATLLSGCKFLPTATAAELTAILKGLQWTLGRNIREVVVFTDSRKSVSLLTVAGATTAEITEARIAKLIAVEIAACADVQIRCISGDLKHSPPHRLWHRMCDSLAREH